MSGLVGCLLLLAGLPGFLGRAILLSIIYWVRKAHGLQSCAHSRGPGVSTIPTALLTPEDPIQPKRLLLSTSITVGIHTPHHHEPAVHGTRKKKTSTRHAQCAQIHNQAFKWPKTALRLQLLYLMVACRHTWHHRFTAHDHVVSRSKRAWKMPRWYDS